MADTDRSPVSPPGPAIALDKLCLLVSLARAFDIQDQREPPEEGADPADDDQLSMLKAHPGDPTEDELRTTIANLDEDEQIDLVALVWLGRGDGEVTDWPSLRSRAADEHNDRTAEYLMGFPLLSDFLEEGMNAFGLSCET